MNFQYQCFSSCQQTSLKYPGLVSSTKTQNDREIQRRQLKVSFRCSHGSVGYCWHNAFFSCVQHCSFWVGISTQPLPQNTTMPAAVTASYAAVPTWQSLLLNCSITEMLKYLHGKGLSGVLSKACKENSLKLQMYMGGLDSVEKINLGLLEYYPHIFH